MHLQSEVLKDFEQPEFDEATRVFIPCRQAFSATPDDI